MIKEKISELLFDRIPKNARVAIFGAYSLGNEIYKDILINRKDVKVNCFIDNNKEGEFCNLPIITLKEIVAQKNNYDLVIITSFSAQYLITNIFDIYDIPFITVDKFIMGMYEGKNTLLNDANYNKVLNIFSNDEDKKLFDIIFQSRSGCSSKEKVVDYFNKNYPITQMTNRTIKNQYLDKIVKKKVKTVLDLGFNSGINALAYDRLLPNLTHIYGFEPIYDVCKIKEVEYFLPKEKITIINSVVGEAKGETSFFIDVNCTPASFADFSCMKTTSSRKYKEITAEVTTIDDFCTEKNVHPDLIKMDIEGSEPSALKGGMNVIKKARPQLAISSYHSDSDFINIPIYLHENLENYTFKMGHYSPDDTETVFYAIPNEYIE